MDLQKLTRTSLAQLTEMSDLLNDLDEKLGNHSPQDVMLFNIRFDLLQQHGQETDALLMAALREGSPDSETRLLLENRKVLQEKLLMALNNTLPKARRLKLLLHNEILSVKKGRNAISGYNTLSGTRSSKIIDRRF